jgi:hypothetical protein
MSELEIRQFTGRAAKPTVGSGNKLSGRAAPFNSPTMIGGAFREQIHPNAWNKTLADGDQVLLDNHDSARPLARRSAGTLELHAGHNGVNWEASASKTTYAQDVLENVRAGNYGGCSFSFNVTKGGDHWDEDTPDGIPLRTLMDIKVREISIVTFPAYDDTSVQARSQVDLAMEYRYRYWAPTMESYAEELRAANKPYGDVEYADPKNGKYPIDTKAHAKAAWSYVNQADNAAKYPMNGVTLSSVKDKIRAACKKFGITVSDDEKDSAVPFENVRLYECEDFELRTRVDYTDEQWSALQAELKWLDRNLLIPGGEPDSSTHLTKEETALLAKRMEDQRRAIYESRKSSFAK